MMVRVTWRRAVAAALAAVLLALGVAWSGVINLAADLPDPPPMAWLLHFSFRSSTRTYAAIEVKAPATDPSGLVSAAAHFAATCATCHGAPGEPPSPVMHAANPAAPNLQVNAKEWTDKELFWILKHGVKFSGMPAWPVQSRDDEVRRMAAFVRRLPGMTPTQYRTLAYGPGERIRGGLAVTLDDALPDCARCHGDDGLGRGQPEIPILAGQNAPFAELSLRRFASGERDSGVMGASAAGVSPSLYAALADHYRALPGPLGRRSAPASSSDAQSDRTAALIIANGLPAANLPACASCHAPGKSRTYPILEGQKATYLAARLGRWQADGDLVEARQSMAVMPTIARRIPEDMIAPLARRYEAQGNSQR